MNVKELMKRFLEEEGFKSEWDESGVLFKFQGLKIYCEFYDNHPSYLELTISFPSKLPRCVALDLCNELNPTSVLKHYLIDDNTLVVSYGEFKESPEVSNESVMEILEILVHGAYRFDERMDELTSYLSHPANKAVN